MSKNGTNTTSTDSCLARKMFTLRKDEQRWLWRGYLTLTWNFGAKFRIFPSFPDKRLFIWQYATNEDWLDGLSSFPTLKPDIDLYGVPPRSRKQRGWHHVHRPHCTLCFPTSSTTCSPTAISASAALRLPSEIIHQIVETKGLVRTQVALVCKHWAHVCLGVDWTAELHGRAHVMKLRTLAASPGCYLRGAIQNVTSSVMYPREEDDPWLHLLSATRKILPNCVSGKDTVEIDGPLGKGLSTMRSIHAYLPRQLPSLCSDTIRSLTLREVHFRRLGDLAHTLEELRSLQRFSGLMLTWTDSTPLHWRERSRFSVLQSVYLSSCTRNLEAISLVNGARYDCIHLRIMLESLVRADSSITVRVMQEHLGGTSTVMCMYYIVLLVSVHDALAAAHAMFLRSNKSGQRGATARHTNMAAQRPCSSPCQTKPASHSAT